jgi:hypothetical protein
MSGARKGMISLNDIEQVFNEDVVVQLAATAKLPPGADLVRFAANLRIDARLFIEAKARVSGPQLRESIERLYSLNRRAESGDDIAARRLARALDARPIDVWRRLSPRIPQARGIPTAAEVLAPETRQCAVERLRLILTVGGVQVIGRKRRGARRSRSFKPLLRIPARNKPEKDWLGRPIGSRGRPRGEAEREFVRNLALTYLEATGKLPPDTANFNVDIRGPFSKFVHRCFELAGARSGNVTRLINEFGSKRREGRHRAQPFSGN